MTRKLITLALLGATAVPALLAVGCASENATEPYKLTGKTQENAASGHEAWRQQIMYTDEKGHYHPELAAQQRPLRSVPE
ncbi:MAG: hypothetical protein JWP03_4575 [Phycisphaerales bacterium]|jgi:hypothetical protein|nr:hypothetical protein [Phycisphaerales bacterium]